MGWGRKRGNEERGKAVSQKETACRRREEVKGGTQTIRNPATGVHGEERISEGEGGGGGALCQGAWCGGATDQMNLGGDIL